MISKDLRQRICEQLDRIAVRYSINPQDLSGEFADIFCDLVDEECVVRLLRQALTAQKCELDNVLREARELRARYRNETPAK